METKSNIAVLLKSVRRHIVSATVVIGVASAIYYDYSLTQKEKAEKAQKALKQ